MEATSSSSIASIVGGLIPLTYLVFLVAERLWPARAQPRVPRWWGKGLLFFLLGGALNALVAPPVSAWAARHRLLDLASLGPVAGTLIGIVVVDFAGYWWHRLRHAWGPLWRLHQLHHSSERLDAIGA